MLLEFTDGHLEVLPIPTDRHQAISQFLFLALFPFVGALGGKVLRPCACASETASSASLIFCSSVTHMTRGAGTTTGAAPIRSSRSSAPTTPGGICRSNAGTTRKYAEARIPEYWAVSPIDETIAVLTLADDAYTEHGVFRRGRGGIRYF